MRLREKIKNKLLSKKQVLKFLRIGWTNNPLNPLMRQHIEFRAKGVKTEIETLKSQLFSKSQELNLFSSLIQVFVISKLFKESGAELIFKPPLNQRLVTLIF